VTKPKSYALGNGKRACREHEETQKIQEELKAAKQKAIEEAEAKKREEEERKNAEAEERLNRIMGEMKKCPCSICGKRKVSSENVGIAISHNIDNFRKKVGKYPDFSKQAELEFCLLGIDDKDHQILFPYNKESKLNHRVKFSKKHLYHQANEHHFSNACSLCYRKLNLTETDGKTPIGLPWMAKNVLSLKKLRELITEEDLGIQLLEQVEALTQKKNEELVT
jgi:hypothetical protein